MKSSSTSLSEDVSGSSGEQPSFSLGLALAGAASGGAYSAGVIDFLLEALQSWQNAKDNEEAVPRWNVRISDVAGTSAGALTATVLSSLYNTVHIPFSPERASELSLSANPLYGSWVTLTTPERLFDISDIDEVPIGERMVQSAFNAKFFQDAAEKVFTPPLEMISRPSYFDPNCTVAITTTNLRGVAYSLNDFQSTISPRHSYGMKRHSDYVRFHFTLPGDDDVNKPLPDSREVRLDQARDTDAWKELINAARASSAFPFGFPTVRVNAKQTDYDSRFENLPRVATDGDEYTSYAAVDGGILNNEPFGLLQQQMEQRHNRRMSSNPAVAWGSVILVDPLPGSGEDSKLDQEGLPLTQLLAPLLIALQQEAMFKDSEIAEALDASKMNRFMIIPDRNRPTWQPDPLATASLRAFAGFLDERFRVHDFMLGRRNCQTFLEKVLRIPTEGAKENPIFQDHKDFLTGDYVPIVPLVGKAAEEVVMPQWPVMNDNEATNIANKIAKLAMPRMSRVIDIFLVNANIITPQPTLNPLRWGVNGVVGVVKRRLEAFLINKIEEIIKNSLTPYIPPRKVS